MPVLSYVREIVCITEEEKEQFLKNLKKTYIFFYGQVI